MTHANRGLPLPQRLITQIQGLARQGHSQRRVALFLGLSRNTVALYWPADVPVFTAVRRAA